MADHGEDVEILAARDGSWGAAMWSMSTEDPVQVLR